MIVEHGQDVGNSVYQCNICKRHLTGGVCTHGWQVNMTLRGSIGMMVPKLDEARERDELCSVFASGQPGEPGFWPEREVIETLGKDHRPGEPTDGELLDALERHLSYLGTGSIDHSGETEIDEVHGLVIDLIAIDETGDAFADCDTLRDYCRAIITQEVTPKPEPEQPTVSCDDLTSDDIQAAHYDQLKPWPHTRFQGRDVLRGPEPEVTG